MPRPATPTRQRQELEGLSRSSYDGAAAALALDRIVVEDRVTVAFQHLHLVLVAVAQGQRERTSAKGSPKLSAISLPPESARWRASERRAGTMAGAGSSEVEQRAAAVERQDDPIIRNLSDALADTERSGDRHAVIHADALRLAIAVRQFSLKAGAEAAAGHDNPAGEAIAGRSIRALQKWRLRRVVEYVDNHLATKIALLDLAAIAGLSRMHFASQFRAATGIRPHEYVLRQRIRRADELLRHSTMPIVEVALTVGFQTQAHFTTVFKRIAGSTPYQWRNAHYSASQPLTQTPAKETIRTARSAGSRP